MQTIANLLRLFFFFLSSPQVPIALFAEHVEVGPLGSSLGDMALFDPLTTYGNFIQQKWILPVSLVQILQETCTILSIWFCGSVEELHAVRWGISHLPLPLATLLMAMHSHQLPWAGSGDHQTCPWTATDLPDSRKKSSDNSG